MQEGVCTDHLQTVFLCPTKRRSFCGLIFFLIFFFLGGGGGGHAGSLSVGRGGGKGGYSTPGFLRRGTGGGGGPRWVRG